MKKILLLALVAVIMAGCGRFKGSGSVSIIGYDTVIIDSCEYVSGYNVLAHKGNCKYCAQRDSIKWEKRKQELIKVKR